MSSLNIEVVADEVINECPVCYEKISATANNCMTTCRHSFCLSCILRCSKNGNNCPICRSELDDTLEVYTTVSEDDTSSESTYDYRHDEDDSDDDDDGDDEPNDNETDCSIEYVSKILQEKGYTMLDIVSILLGRFKNEEIFTREYCEVFEDNVYNIIQDLDDDKMKENAELKLMMLEDSR